MDEIPETKQEPIDVDDDDPIVKEIDVYLARSLANKIYILQYPIKPKERTLDETKIYAARIKPKTNRLELELEINTNSENYSKVKGEQFALNVDGKLMNPLLAAASGKQKQEKQQPQRYFKSNYMDKQVLTSTNACLGQMNRLYHLGILNPSADKLSLTPIKTILQMKPSFDYFDIFEKKVQDKKESGNSNENDYSTEEELDMEADKAELITLRYSSSTNSSQPQEQEQNWTNVSFNNIDDDYARNLNNLLDCQNKQNFLKLDMSNEELVRKSVDINFNLNIDPIKN